MVSRAVLPLIGRGALLAAALSVGGATAGPAATQPAAANPAEELAAAETAGSQLLFDYDFDEALEHYARVSERFPEHPTGPYNLATTIWTRLAQRSNGMRGSSLRNDRFFSQQGRPETTPEEEAAFREHLEEAYRRAEDLLEQDPDDVEALYYLGATEGLESGWAVIVDRAWFRAARTIRRGVRRHRRVQELDPGFKDAYAVPGAYDYGIATLPRPLRMLVFLFGMRGDREGGLRGVQITADEGRRARWGGLWTYALLMQREEQEDEALAATRRLTRKFPRNPDFVLDEVSILMAQGDFEAARELAEVVLERRRGRLRELPPRAAGAGRSAARGGPPVRGALGGGGGRPDPRSRSRAEPRGPGRPALPAGERPGRGGEARYRAHRLRARHWGRRRPGARRVGDGSAAGAVAGRRARRVAPRTAAGRVASGGFTTRSDAQARERRRMAPMPPGGATHKHGNADLRSAPPRAAGRAAQS